MLAQGAPHLLIDLLSPLELRLQLIILLPQLPSSWAHRLMPSGLIFEVLLR